MKAFNRNKYNVDLIKMNTICERNYFSINQLVAEWEPLQAKVIFETSPQSIIQIKILEVSRYTNLVEIRQLSPSLPDVFQPNLIVRVYHDAKMAEVISCQNIGRIQPSYLYPNKQMHQPDEKLQINAFLNDWLNFCQEHGMSTPVKVFSE